MKTNKLLAFAAIALLLINGVLVYMLWSNKQSDRRGNGNRGNRGDWFAEQLKLDSNQKAEHKKLRDAHFEVMKPLSDSVSAYRKALFSLSKENNTSDSTVKYYSAKLAAAHAVIAEQSFDHFKKVRALLKPDQYEKFDELVEKMMSRRGGPHGRPPDNKKD